jgi:hypothetical protein
MVSDFKFEVDLATRIGRRWAFANEVVDRKMNVSSVIVFRYDEAP